MAHLWSDTEGKKIEVLEEKPMLVPLHPPQIPQGQA